MFERFTREARAAVTAAREEAERLRHEAIGPQHLLLGLAAGDVGVAGSVLSSLGLRADELRAEAGRLPAGPLDAAALASIGIDLDEVRRRVEETFGPGALSGRRPCDRTPFAAEAKRVLERSLQEALALRDRHIGGEHILLALVSEPRGPVAELLRRAGQSPEAVRAATLAARRPAA